MARLAAAALAPAAALLLAGCDSDGTRQQVVSTAAVACDDAAFRAQDEELYVTKTAIANARAEGGEPSILLRDLRLARRALGGYLDAHPPCDDALQEVAASEREALGSLDEAIAALAAGNVAPATLDEALKRLEEAQATLSAAP